MCDGLKKKKEKEIIANDCTSVGFNAVSLGISYGPWNSYIAWSIFLRTLAPLNWPCLTTVTAFRHECHILVLEDHKRTWQNDKNNRRIEKFIVFSLLHRSSYHHRSTYKLHRRPSRIKCPFGYVTRGASGSLCYPKPVQSRYSFALFTLINTQRHKVTHLSWPVGECGRKWKKGEEKKGMKAFSTSVFHHAMRKGNLHSPKGPMWPVCLSIEAFTPLDFLCVPNTLWKGRTVWCAPGV